MIKRTGVIVVALLLAFFFTYAATVGVLYLFRSEIAPQKPSPIKIEKGLSR